MKDSIYRSPNAFLLHHRFVEQSEQPHPFYHAESHTSIELTLVLSGRIDYLIEGAQYSVTAGDLIVINAREFHTSKIDHTQPYEHINLHFPPSFIPTLKDVDVNNPFVNAHLYQHILPSSLVKKTKIEATLRKISKLGAGNAKYKDLTIISLIQDLTVQINVAVDTLLQKEYHLLLTPKITNELFQSSINYINANITKNITAADVSAELGVSESYVYRLFKNILGITVQTYIQHQKMRLALSLLRKGHSAQNVSEMLGYEYYATFFNHFKHIFGKTPNEFK